MLPAIRNAVSTCVPAGTTRLTMPRRCAVAASMRSSPSRMISLACLGPVSHGSSMVTIPAPNLSSGSPKMASSAAMVRSQASASSNAPARQAPWTAAIVGLGQCQNRIVVRKSRSRISRQASGPLGRRSICSFRSKPEENALPAPLITTARTSASPRRRIQARVQLEQGLSGQGVQALWPAQLDVHHPLVAGHADALEHRALADHGTSADGHRFAVRGASKPRLVTPIRCIRAGAARLRCSARRRGEIRRRPEAKRSR